MTTPNYEEELKAAAEAGNIDLLYAVIEQDEFVLDRIDSKPFVQTPLHVAVYAGHLQFAIEVMRLKPSYAYKLNQQGFCPIHLAMQRVQKLINQLGGDPIQLAIQKCKMMMMVRYLVETDNDLVRVKGREGITPLHFATQIGEVNLLAAFLFACPNSIGDVNVRGETPLHLAVKYNQYDALQVLVGFLKSGHEFDDFDVFLQTKTLNSKDYEGNTVLHISTLSTDSRALQLLVKTTRIYLEARNLNNLTALDMVATTNAEMQNILSSAGAKPSSQVKDAPMLAQILKTKVTFMDTIISRTFHIRNIIPEEQRNTYLLGATLVATSIYQSSLSPPGGFYGDNNEIMNTTVSMNTMRASQTNLGKSVLSGSLFLFFSLWNTFSLLCSTITIFLMTPVNWMEGYLFAPLCLFVCGYASNMGFISPTSATRIFNYTVFIVLLSFYFLWIYYYNCLRPNRRFRLWV